MRKRSIWFVAASVAIVWSTAVWAVTDGSFTAQDERGKPIDGATVTVTVLKKPDPTKPTIQKRRIARTIRSHTTSTGKAELVYDEKKTSDDDNVALIVLKKGGMTWTTTMPLSSLGNGVPVTFTLTTGTSLVAGGTPSTSSPMPGGTWSNSVPFAGFGLSGFLSVNYGEQTNKEYLTLTDMLTNSLDDSNARLGGGVGLVYNVPINVNFLAGPFVNVNFPNQSIIRNFPNGSSIGTTNTAVVTFGGQFGIPFKLDQTPALVYLQLGGSETQKNLKINFAMPSVDTQTIWGGTIGVGAAIQPQNLRIGDKPVTLFAQLNGTFWQDGRYVGPAGSRPYSYVVQRDDVTLLVGATVWFSPGK